MELLELSQIIFNLTFSLVALIIGIFVILIADRVFKSVRAAERFFDSLEEKSAKAYKHLAMMLAGVSVSSFIAKIFKKHKKE